MSVTNVVQGTVVSIYVIKNGLGEDGDAGFYKSCLMDLFPDKLPEMIESLDSLIENEEVVK